MANPIIANALLLLAAAAVAFSALHGAEARHSLTERKLQDTSVTFLIACDGGSDFTESRLRRAVEAAGCALTWFPDDIGGLATAGCPAGVALSTATPSFAGLGVSAVSQDETVPLDFPAIEVTDAAAANEPTTTAASGGPYDGPLTGAAGEPNDPWWRLQWGPRSIGAPAAWAKGINGRCVRVGVVDSDFGPPHPDLVNKIDYNASRSFVAGLELGTTNRSASRHAQMVSGVIAAEANNNYGTVGVAYGATIVGSRIGTPPGSATTSALLQGIYHAAQRRNKGGGGADVINLSYGGNNVLPRGYSINNQTFIAYINKVTAFAHRHGVLIIVSAGNSAWDMDAITRNSSFVRYCEAPNVVCVASNAPVGICPECNGNSTFDCAVPLNFAGANYSQLARYSNYGRAIAVTAPGGDSATRPKPCWINDAMVTVISYSSTYQFGATFTAGTSFSAPHVAALAALYIQKAAMDKGVLESELCNPNRVKTFVSPGQIKTAIMRGAVLPPGNRGEMQRRFGAGIINVKNTLGL